MPKVSNIVMLGAYVEVTKCVKPESIIDALLHKLGERKKHLIPVNEQALAKGAEAAQAMFK